MRKSGAGPTGLDEYGFRVPLRGRQPARINRGRRGRPVNPQTAVRDGLIFDQVTRMKAEGISYDGALDRVADMFPGDQRDMIEKAYKNECARQGN